MEKGPGFLRDAAHLVGFSVAVPGQPPLYVPLEHEQGDNYHDKAEALRWLKAMCAKDSTKIFHNAMYDIEALDSEGIEVAGTWRCTMVTESIIDENARSYSLDNTAHRHLGRKKDETLLREAAEAFGINAKSEMYKLPPEYVGPYAEQDAALLIPLLKSQNAIIVQEELLRVYDLESRLLKVVWAMRKQGVRVDEPQAVILRNQWQMELDRIRAEIKDAVGYDVDIWSAKDLVKLCNTYGYDYPLTEKGKPSFENVWLVAHDDTTFNRISRARKIDKVIRDVLDGIIGSYVYNGRIHAQFHTTRRDDKGTRSGRFSSSNPNLQQIPARDPEFGPALRKLFIPDVGAEWCKLDYSSQEPRITVHFATINNFTGAKAVAEKFKKNKAFCLHGFAGELVGTSRSDAKAIGLGLTYGLGLDNLAIQLGVDVAIASQRKQSYMQGLPFVSETANHFSRQMKRQGYVCTALGRRARIDDPRFAYKAVNRAIQGTGADMIKQAMVDIWEKHEIAPLLTVHDELDFNIYDRDFIPELCDIMENAIPLKVPALVEPDIGPSFGELASC